MGIVASLCESKESQKESFLSDTSLIQKKPPTKETPLPHPRRTQPSLTSKTLTIEDFRIVKVIGEGSFGKVKLVQEKKTGAYYALKSFNKNDILKKNMFERILSEKDILKELKHPFLVRLRYSFQGNKKIYMVMDLCQGGDLATYLFNNKKFDEDGVKFIAAEIALALEYIHGELDVIHRDIKPENIMFAADGHIKLTDFGLAKTAIKTFSLCGTPEYVAPEIIVGEGYGKEVDWWSLGCLIFEMMTGRTPFQTTNLAQLPLGILNNKPTMPETFSEELKDLLYRLLAKNPKERLGFKGVAEIKKHPFFRDIDWEALLQKKKTPPFVPTLDGPEDVRYFDKAHELKPTDGGPKEKKTHYKTDSKSNFPAFSYVDLDP